MLACPNCEYENNGKGRPVVRGEIATCLVCGSSWKEYSDGYTPTPASMGQTPLPGPDRDPGNSFFQRSTPPEKPRAKKPDLRNPLVAFCACLLIALGIWSWTGTKMMPENHSALAVADVRLEMNKRQNGARIVTVKGKIRNNTADRRMVPPVIIVLRDKQGSEISRWRYNSLKVALNPGSAARFSSSIQHASTRIATADILLQ